MSSFQFPKLKEDVNTPKGFCQCGCGEKTRISDRNRPKKGHVKGKPFPYIAGHSNRKYSHVQFLVWYRQEFEKGRILTEIAKELGITVETLRRCAKEADVHLSPSNGKCRCGCGQATEIDPLTGSHRPFVGGHWKRKHAEDSKEPLVEKAVFLYESGLRIREVAKEIGLGYGTTNTLLHNAGVDMRSTNDNAYGGNPNRHFSQEKEKRIVNEWDKSGRCTAEFDRKNGLTRQSVYRLAKRHSRDIGRRKLRKLDENAFSEICEESAYWAGFLAADGGVDQEQKLLHVNLQRCDEGHLYKLARFLKTNHPVGRFVRKKDGRKYSSIRVTSRILCADLEKNWNITPRKSESMTPPALPFELQRHWLRGLWDGDGCLGFCTIKDTRVKSKKYETPQASIVGSHNVVRFAADYIYDRFGGRCKKKLTKCKNTKIAVFTTSYKGVRICKAIATEFYGNCSVALKRKLAIAERMMSLVPNSSYSRHFKNC